jgi:glycosyltransferase involved in cell wall biosynthesis
MSTPQHIVFLGPAHPYRGGIASFTERLAREFQSTGHTCTLVTFTLQYPGFLFPGKTQFAKQSAPDDLKILRWVNTINPFNWIKTGFSLRNLKPDIIIVRYWMPFFAPAFGTILRIAGFLTKTRIICIADNIIPHEKRPGDGLLTSYFNGAVDGYVVMSEQVRADLNRLAIHKNNILHPHPLFDHFGEQMDEVLARQKLGFQLNNSILLFFGFIRKYKGLDLLLEAMTDARIREKGFQLIIAGEFYEEEEKYLDYIKRHQLSATVHIQNQFIPENSIPLYFSAADVLIQPYRNATQSGVTPLAMHFNLPMIVTNAGGLSEMVQNGVTGLVVDISPEAIANGILAYFEKGKAYYREHLKTYKTRFSWTAMAKTLLDFSVELGDQKPK